VPAPDAHAAVARLQRQHVAGAAEVRGLRRRVRQRAACLRAVGGADTGRDAGGCRIHRDGVGGAVRVGVVGDHLRELQRRGARDGEGRADVARRVSDHEGGFGRGEG